MLASEMSASRAIERVDHCVAFEGPVLRRLGDNFGNDFSRDPGGAARARCVLQQALDTEFQESLAPQGRHAGADAKFAGDL
jgi:hypothetical protein